MDNQQLLHHIKEMLKEDVGSGDVTTEITPNKRITAVIRSNSNGYASGIHELGVLFRGHRIKATPKVKDGGKVRRNQVVFVLEGRVNDILPLERVSLNLLSRMSGVTTLTRKYALVLKKAKSKAKVVATRKTAPGLMRLDKKAVALGGGLTHRMGLYDMVLIKDNHLKVFGKDVNKALAAAKKAKNSRKIEVEVSSTNDALTAIKCGAGIVMFDNMRPNQIKAAIDAIRRIGLRRKVLLEASGGVNLANLKAYGKTGVDWISAGRLTQSAEALDYTLDVIKVKGEK
jgi:nicotinate-nucleotide pyrophosphorylase (carboxylating)